MAKKYEGPCRNEAHARMKADEIRFSKGAVVTETVIIGPGVPKGKIGQPGYYVEVKMPGEK